MRESHYRDAVENIRATDDQASVLHDGLEAGHLEAFPGVVDGFLVSVGADQDVIILISLRRLHKRREIFLAQIIRKRHRVRFFGKRGYLQAGASGGTERRDTNGL